MIIHDTLPILINSNFLNYRLSSNQAKKTKDVLVVGQDYSIKNKIISHITNINQNASHNTQVHDLYNLYFQVEIFNIPEYLSKKKYDLIVIDLTHIRQITSKSDILLFVSKLTRISIIVIGLKEHELEYLQSGADDFISSESRAEIILTKVNIAINRNSKEVPNLIIKNELTCNFETNQVFINDKVVPLASAEYNIFATLAQSPDQNIDKPSLLEVMKRPSHEFKLIDVYICKIRQKLREAGASYQYIETIWNGGFRFMTHPHRLSSSIKGNDTINVDMNKINSMRNLNNLNNFENINKTSESFNKFDNLENEVSRIISNESEK